MSSVMSETSRAAATRNAMRRMRVVGMGRHTNRGEEGTRTGEREREDADCDAVT